MKRLLIIWALFLCSFSSVFAQYSGSGSGTLLEVIIYEYRESIEYCHFAILGIHIFLYL